MTKKQFNMTDCLNKKPDTTNQKNTDQEKSVQIREIRGDKNTISVNSWTKGKAYPQVLLTVVRCLLTSSKKSNFLQWK